MKINDLQLYEFQKIYLPKVITGNGKRYLLAVKELIPELNIHEVKTELKFLTGKFLQWNISDAYIICPDGKKS